MENSTWVPVKNYQGYYEINKNGRVRSLHKRNLHQLLQQRIDRAGYYTVRLNVNGVTTTHWVHRLMGMAFVPNPVNNKYINHRNGNKIDNRIENLEWVSQSQNIKHAYQNGLIRKTGNANLKVIDSCTDKVYESVREAADATGIAYSTCKNYLNGNRPNPTCLKYAA